MNDILEISNINLFTEITVPCINAGYNCFNYAFFSEDLKDIFKSYLKRLYSFGLSDLHLLFNQSVSNFEEILSKLNKEEVVNFPYETLVRSNSYFHNFNENCEALHKFEIEHLEIRYASKIITSGLFPPFEFSESFFVLARYSFETKALCFDLYDFNQLFSYLLKQKPTTCPSTSKPLTIMADYTFESGASFLTPSFAFTESKISGKVVESL